MSGLESEAHWESLGPPRSGDRNRDVSSIREELHVRVFEIDDRVEVTTFWTVVAFQSTWLTVPSKFPWQRVHFGSEVLAGEKCVRIRFVAVETASM